MAGREHHVESTQQTPAPSGGNIVALSSRRIWQDRNLPSWLKVLMGRKENVGVIVAGPDARRASEPDHGDND